jgi:hypothetical protein
MYRFADAHFNHHGRPTAGSPEYLAETNNPNLDQQVSIAFIVIDTFFLFIF